MSTGSSYDIAKMTAALTGSYLVTDLHVKWCEIQLDRESHGAENAAWSPFAKALQGATLNYLNEVRLEDALALRREGRLESFRSFLRRVWKEASSGDPYDETNARLFADELLAEIKNAEEEWKQIDRDLLKIVGAEASAGLLAAGPLIVAGEASFLAAAAAVVGIGTLVGAAGQRRGFPDRFPAAFFMRIPNAAHK